MVMTKATASAGGVAKVVRREIDPKTGKKHVYVTLGRVEVPLDPKEFVQRTQETKDE
jgi:hypothetical protein